MLALLGGVALAGILSGFNEPTDLGVSGRHARPFYTDDGERWLGVGRSGSFHYMALDADGSADASTWRTIVPGSSEVKDHSFVPCEGEGFLHIASGNRDTRDDTAWASFVGPDLVLRGTALLVDADPRFSTNDNPVVCADAVWATAFAMEGGMDTRAPPSNAFLAFGPSLFGGGGEVQTVQVPEAVRSTGTSMVWRPDTRQVLMIGIVPPNQLRVVALDEDLIRSSVSDRELQLDGLEAYWAQSSVEVEGGLLTVHMIRNPEAGFAQDTGNVALTLLSPELAVLETVVLTDVPAPNGAMRPALAVDGEEVVVSYDVSGVLHTVVGRVDREALAALAVDPVETTAGEAIALAIPRPAAVAADPVGCASIPDPQRSLTGSLLLLIVVGRIRRRTA